MRNTHKRLSYEDRVKIEEMLNKGERIVTIAKAIGCHRATIYNELKRCSCKPYKAIIAQKNLK